MLMAELSGDLLGYCMQYFSSMDSSREPAIVHLDEAGVREALAGITQDDLINLMRETFLGLGDGSIGSTDRVRAHVGGHMASAMAAAVPSLGVTGGKLYSTVDGRFTFLIALFDLEGKLLCTMDGAPVTEARTPALSALVIKVLAKDTSHGAAVIGSGRECLPHLRMLDEVVDGPVRLWGRSRERAEACREAAEREGIVVEVSPSVSEAVDQCGVVITLTSADDPVLLSGHINDDVLVCAIGATKPQRCEIDPALVGRSSAVVTDWPTGARVECGDLIRAAESGHFDWGNLVGLSALLHTPGLVPRAGVRGPALFESQGVAAQDVATAALVWQAHLQRG